MNLRESLENETVANVGYRKPVKVQEGQSVRFAINRMRKEKFGCLLVLDGKRLTGIFTERDFMTRVLQKKGAFALPISEFMTPDPTIAHIDEPIYRVLARMHAGGMRHLPVLNTKGRPVGTISVGHVAHFLADLHPTTVYNLPPDPDQFPSTREGG